MTGEDRSVPSPDWDAVVPHVFDNRCFRQTGRRLWQGAIEGNKVAIVVAFRPSDRTNFALNTADFDKLLDVKRKAKCEAAFVVLADVSANSEHRYVGDRDAEQTLRNLEVSRFLRHP
jgi:hypothetical protein